MKPEPEVYWITDWKVERGPLPKNGFRKGSRLLIYHQVEMEIPSQRLVWEDETPEPCSIEKLCTQTEDWVEVKFGRLTLRCRVVLSFDSGKLTGADLTPQPLGAGGVLAPGDGNTGTVVVSDQPPTDGSS